MENIMKLLPNDWVTEELLMFVTGFTSGRIRACRENSWRQGKEWLKVSPKGTPEENSQAMYHIPSINKWIAKQGSCQPAKGGRKCHEISFTQRA